MFSHGAATLAVDNSSEQSSIIDRPARGFSTCFRDSDRPASGGRAEADTARSPAAPVIGAAAPDPRTRRGDPAARLSVGLILYLISVGLVASATIAIFFGIAFLLLLPADGTRGAGSPNPVAQIDLLIHGLWASSDSSDRPTGDRSEPMGFRQPMAGSNAGTGSSVIPAVARPAAAEVLPLQANDPAGTNDAAPTSTSPLVSETVSHAEATDAGRGLLTAASTHSPPEDSAAAPVSLAPPVHSSLSAADVANLLDHGDALLRIGDIVSARLFYERAADAGDRRAALHLGASYDPAFLGRAGLGKLQADAAQARFWYGRAFDLEAAEVKRRQDSGAAK